MGIGILTPVLVVGARRSFRQSRKQSLGELTHSAISQPEPSGLPDPSSFLCLVQIP